MAACGHERIYVSSSALKARTLPELVDECAALGIRRVELTSSLEYSPDMTSDLGRARAAGFRFLIHNYFPPPREPFVINLASADLAIRRRSIAHCEAALRLSAELAAPFYSVHAGFVTDPARSELGREFLAAGSRTIEDAIPVFHDTVARLCETAEQVGVDLLIENNVVSPANAPDGRNRLFLGVGPEDFESLAAAVASPRLGALLDVGHLKVSATALGIDARQALERMRPHVRALHLSDNDGLVDGNRAFMPDAWFVPSLATFTHAWFSIETRPLDDPVLLACLKTVEDAI
jgi:sugar phosphate isomerase/epimerase